MLPRPLRLPILVFAAAVGGGVPAPPAAAQQAPDNRFFPKEMEDALAAMKGADPEQSFADGLAVLARVRHRDGALEPMRERAFPEILEHALGTRLESGASFAGEILAGLDPGRLAKELEAVAEKDGDPVRLYNAAVLLEVVPRGGADGGEGPEPVDALVRLLGKGNARSRARAAEALGESASARRGCPAKAREKAVSGVLGLLAGAGKDATTKNVCAVALGKIGDPKAIPALLNGIGNTDGKHAFFAALALSWMEEPSLLPTVLSGSISGGESGEAYAKALEGTAREAHVDALLSSLASSGKADVREAAAVALARILPGMPAPAADGRPLPTDAPADQERAALRAKAAGALMERMVSDGDSSVQWACFHALSRSGGPWQEAEVLRLLKSPNEGTLKRAVHLCGDWRLAASAKTLLGGIFSVKDDLMRRRCGIEFWRIGDREAIEEFKKRIRDYGAGGGVGLARGCEALGNWRCKEGFELAVDLLGKVREGSPDQFAVELCLEKMTGHFFGPARGLWNKWFSKNPEFFTPRQAAIERDKWREDFDKENKGFRQTKETERAVQMGLEYLARHQHADGRWDPQGFRECCDRSPGCSAATGARVQEDPVSRTALSILAFLGAGYTPEGGKYSCTLRRGLEYLMARQQAKGDYQTNDLIGGYNRPLALQAYAEAAALTHDPRLLPFVQRGADFLTQIQNSIGGWRYRVDVETSDSSVAAWMLFALKAAEKAGAEVRPVVYEGCRMLFERYSLRVPANGPREDFVDMDPSYGFEVGKDTTYEFRTGYQDTAHAPTHATTALGLMSHILLGFRRSHPFCIGSANYVLQRQLPVAPKDGRLERLNIQQEYPLYFVYYGTLAMHQMGGRYFRKWNDQIRVILPGTQVQEGCGRGSWVGKGYDGIFGSLYTTATGVLALETYYRYLPVLQD
jgi:HEAT repeat protein